MDQVGHLRSAAADYDAGREAAAQQIAVVLRVVVHDAGHSTSLLGQLGLKGSLRFVDTALRPPPGGRLLLPALVMMEVSSASGGRFVAPLGGGPPDRYGHRVAFD